MASSYEKRFDSSSDYSSSDEESINRGFRAMPPPPPPPPPPPIATADHTRARPDHDDDESDRGISSLNSHDNNAVPVAAMPPMPPMPDDADAASSPLSPDGGAAALGRSKSRRRTIKQIIDGWWDLGLLEAQKRQTMLANKRQSVLPGGKA